MSCILAPLETLNKDLYPWFFTYLGAIDAFSFAHSSRYAYGAFLTYLRATYTHCGVCSFDIYRFNNFSLRVYLRDLIDTVCRVSTKVRLLQGMSQRMTHETRVSTFWTAIKMRTPANVKVMLKWIDPGYGNNEPLMHACAHNQPEIVKVLLEDPRITLSHSNVLRHLDGSTSRAEIMHMLLRDARSWDTDIEYAIELAIKYDDYVAFKMMMHSRHKVITPYTGFSAIMRNRVRMIKLLALLMETEQIDLRLRQDKMTDNVRMILQSELNKRKNI